MPYQVLIIGHSFVRHAQEFMECNPAFANLGLDPTTHAVSLMGKTSWDRNIATVADINQDLCYITRRTRGFDLVVFDIGTNDLNNDHALQSRTLVAFLQEVAQRLTANGVKRVAFVHILFRKGKQAICRDLNVSKEAKEDPLFVKEAVSAFFTRAHATNNLLSIRARTSQNMGVIPQKGFGAEWRSHISDQDGVHIKHTSMRTYIRNLRSGILRQANKSRGTRQPCTHPTWLMDG